MNPHWSDPIPFKQFTVTNTSTWRVSFYNSEDTGSTDIGSAARLHLDRHPGTEEGVKLIVTASGYNTAAEYVVKRQAAPLYAHRSNL